MLRGALQHSAPCHVGSLSPETATEIRDLLLKPLEDCLSDILEQKLIEHTAASEQRRLQQLFTAEDLGDRKPMQLLRQMQQLLGEKAVTMDGSLIKELFMQRLLTNVCMVLVAASEKTPLEELAALADKIMEVALPSIATAATPQQATSVDDTLCAENASLWKQILALQAATGPRWRHAVGIIVMQSE